ncbi:MAG TPA: hypothetical protein DCO67_04725, partial [Staphylococcus sp.]|nr:hypothetical protein [Staphylococcus sp.]
VVSLAYDPLRRQHFAKSWRNSSEIRINSTKTIEILCSIQNKKAYHATDISQSLFIMWSLT